MVHHQSNGSGSASGNDNGTSSNMLTSKGNDSRISNGEGDDRDDEYEIVSGNG